MRKRRRLADKLTIMVCAVLVAVSAFFYAPMVVKASEGSTFIVPSSSFEIVTSASQSSSSRYSAPLRFENYSISIDGVFDDDSFYKLDYSYDLTLSHNYSRTLTIEPFIISFEGYTIYNTSGINVSSGYTFNKVGTVILSGSMLNDGCVFRFLGTLFSQSSANITLNVDMDLDVVSLTELSNSESDEYQSGYNAGYSAGEQAGYGNGYSQGFTDGEASVDTNEIYDQGFNAGKESVDTQSYYDAGYQAGYQVAFQEGFDSGYDEGYQSAMDRIDGWGADTSDYPLLLSSVDDYSGSVSCLVKTSFPFQYEVSSDWFSSLTFNPNHTYQFDIDFSYYTKFGEDVISSRDDIWTFDIGTLSYNLIPSSNYHNKFFIPGDMIGSSYSFTWRPILAIYGDEMFSDSMYAYYNVSFDIYDLGPSGDTQNHIANQTDSLTNGFNDSHGNSVNNDFSSGLNDFETAEDSLFATATTGLKDFTFFDIQSVPAMVTGMSFVGSIMSGWFTQAGGASGVGIVLSILFSIMLVAMVLGLYRWYQSKGGKD